MPSSHAVEQLVDNEVAGAVACVNEDFDLIPLMPVPSSGRKVKFIIVFRTHRVFAIQKHS